jgi:uncharacterized protein (TIGR02145 family)
MNETCAVCRKGIGPTKCEICGFSDDGSINRSFPVPEDLNNWLETVVKPYRALWEAKKRENELSAQLEEAKRREAKLLAQISTPAPIPVSPVQQQPSRTWSQPSQWSAPTSAPQEQTSSFSLAKSIVVLLIIIASVVIIKIVLNSDSSKVHFDSGNAHYKKMDYDEAIEDYTVAIKLKPDESIYLNSRGNAYYSRGVKYSNKKDYDLAITDYTTAIKLKPDNPVYLYSRGNAYYNKENYNLAIADFEAALRINPDYANAKRDIKNAQQAQSKLKQNSQKQVTAQPSIPKTPATQVPTNTQQPKMQAPITQGTFTDNRDGKKYKTVKIGSQIWMAENLNYDANGSKCYNNNSSNCDKYGKLYDWEAAKKACPSGWHLPSDAEWITLFNYAGGELAGDGKKLKAKNGWNKTKNGNNGNGTDEYGFAALPGGYHYRNGSFNNVGIYGVWRKANNDLGWQMGYDSKLVINVTYSKSDLLSVRCLR